VIHTKPSGIKSNPVQYGQICCGYQIQFFSMETVVGMTNVLQNDRSGLAHHVLFIFKIVWIVCGCIILVGNLLSPFSPGSLSLTAAAAYVILFPLYMALLARNNWLLFMLSIFVAYFNFSICAANYLNFGITSYFAEFKDDAVSSIGLNILLLFLIVMSLFFPAQPENTKSDANFYVIGENENAPVIIGIVAVLLIFFFLGYKSAATEGARGTPSTFFEYSVILFIIGYYYCGRNKYLSLFMTLLLFLFVYRNISGGGRVTAVQLLLVFFIMNFSYRAKIVKVLPFAVLIWLIAQTVGQERGNFTFSLQIFDGVGSLLSGHVALDTAYSAYFTSLTFVIVGAITSLAVRLNMFLEFFVSIFLGGSLTPGASVSVYTNQYITNYYGGLLPFYFYFYFGWVGVVITGVIAGLYTKMVSRTNSSSTGFVKCMSVYVVATIFRWYLYSPSNLFRGVLLMALVYWLAELFSKQICKLTCPVSRTLQIGTPPQQR